MKIQNPKPKTQNNKGVALYLAIMITGVLLALALGISALLYGQMKVMEGMGDSVLAFYAANTGIENALFIEMKDCGDKEGGERVNCLKEKIPSGEVELDNRAKYKLAVDAGGEEGTTCPVDKSHCVKSVGIYKQTQRAIRIAR